MEKTKDMFNEYSQHIDIEFQMKFIYINIMMIANRDNRIFITVYKFIHSFYFYKVW